VVIMVKETFGFIKFSGSGKSLFYHKTNVQSSNQTLREGDEVECDIIMRGGPGGKEEAVNVRLLTGLSFMGVAAKKTPTAPAPVSQIDAGAGAPTSAAPLAAKDSPVACVF
jgi:cold shock CspA family protein